MTLSCLKDDSELATGDPLYCTSCKAVFNKHSKVEESKHDEDQIWICEFCNHNNKVRLDTEEIPKSEAVNYIIEAASVMQVDEESKTDNITDSSVNTSVLFCIDISGSMGGVAQR